MVEAIIFDYLRTVVDPETNPPSIYPDVIDVLDQIKAKGIKMALVSRGDDTDLRRTEIEQFGLIRYFDVVHIVGQEEDKDFQPVIDQLKIDATKCIVVGDRVKQEIRFGNQLGVTTVWLRREGEKFANEFPESPEEEPKEIITSLTELIPLLDTTN